MLVLPSLAGLIAFLQIFLETTLLGAIFGAAFAGGEEFVNSVHEHGEVNQAVVEQVAESAGEGAIDGAIGGAFTGGVFGVAGPALQPFLNMIDDIFRSLFGWLDDAARGVAKLADDVVKGLHDAANSVANGIRGLFNRVCNGCNIFRKCMAMPDAPVGKRYVYVMKDPANGIHKIGMTSRAPKKRIEEVARQAKSKVDYTCIIQTNADSGLEGDLHQLFSSSRKAHPTPGYESTEWFVLSAAQVAHACSH